MSSSAETPRNVNLNQTAKGVDMPPVNEMSTAQASRKQPWKEFVAVPEKTQVVFAESNGGIRMIDGRVDGKGLGG